MLNIGKCKLVPHLLFGLMICSVIFICLHSVVPESLFICVERGFCEVPCAVDLI